LKLLRFYKLDVSVRTDCFKVVKQIASDLGALHHLVNCVAYFGSESLGATEEDWTKTMKVRVRCRPPPSPARRST
jgi:NAD(P)-dependent dehydrogenase (short-subunit alcohol dehydrogenase family)